MMEIRLIKASDAAMLAKYHLQNAEHFGPWEPERTKDYYLLSQLKPRLSAIEKEQNDGKSAYFIGTNGQEVFAHCHLSNIIYGPLQACHMGYGVAKEYEGKGVMTQVCIEAIDYAFRNLKLNRIMASYMPSNNRSAALLNKLGFSIEGVAKRYLNINGNWEDHVMTSLLNPVRSENENV